MLIDVGWIALELSCVAFVAFNRVILRVSYEIWLL